MKANKIKIQGKRSSKTKGRKVNGGEELDERPREDKWKGRTSK
jgi:hypothetical protein